MGGIGGGDVCMFQLIKRIDHFTLSSPETYNLAQWSRADISSDSSNR